MAATSSATANEVMHRLYTPDWPRSRVAASAPLVDEAAMAGDAVARDILLSAAQQLATLASSVRNQLWEHGEPARVAWVGGVFKSRILLERYCRIVELRGRQHNVSAALRSRGRRTHRSLSRRGTGRRMLQFARMRRSWNSLIWLGFAIALLAALTYIPIFARYAITRDVPWVNLLMFFAGGWLLVAGLKRAYSTSDRYGGKVSGAISAALALVIFGLFCWGNFVFARRVPASISAPQPADVAPEFTLYDSDGRPVSLSDLRRNSRGVLLIFYRGYW